MAKTLVVHTHAIDENGRPVHFAPGDPVPTWAAKQLTNPKLYGGEPAESQEPSGNQAPPRSGRGSNIDAWRRFAEQNGVEYDTHASREEIIAACEQAGLVEQEG